jgi:hypothetical protein
MQQMFFIADLIACSTCFGHHYAHHQELESIIQLVAACGLWCVIYLSCKANARVYDAKSGHGPHSPQSPRRSGFT